jgi:hypothetical protein
MESAMNDAKRVTTYAFVILAVLLITPAALTAPFQLGLLSDEQRNVVLAMAIFFGFIAIALLLPDFDGRTDEDWDMQGQDDLWKH